MSAHTVYENAPLGSLHSLFRRHAEADLRASQRSSRRGKPQRRRAPRQEEPARERPNWISPASFTLHEGDFGSGGVVVLTVRRTYSLDSDLRFEIVERPAIGAVRILREYGDNAELLHLAKATKRPSAG